MFFWVGALSGNARSDHKLTEFEPRASFQLNTLKIRKRNKTSRRTELIKCTHEPGILMLLGVAWAKGGRDWGFSYEHKSKCARLWT